MSTLSTFRAYARERLYEGALNMVWLLVTAALLATTHLLWPFRTWLWGLALGASVGGGSVFIVGSLELWRRSR